MTGASELLLLDTSIVIHLIRDNEVGKRVDAEFQIRHRPDRPLISVVTIGECLSLSRQFRCRTLIPQNPWAMSPTTSSRRAGPTAGSCVMTCYRMRTSRRRPADDATAGERKLSRCDPRCSNFQFFENAKT